MKLLFVLAYVPGPSFGGSSIVSYNFIKRLASHHEVHVFCFRSLLESADEALASKHMEELGVGITQVDFVPPAQTAWNKLRQLLSPIPYMLQPYSDCRIEDAYTRTLNLFQPDIIHVENTQMGWCVDVTPPEIPIMINAHNVEADRVRSQRRTYQLNRIQALMYAWEGQRIEWAERRIMRRVGWISTVTDEDTARMTSKYGVTAISTVRIGVDLDRFPPLAPCDEAHIVFAGSMFYAPNVDAMSWFCHDILPLIRVHIPDVKLYIVGRHPSPAVQQLHLPPTVTVVGSVPEVVSYFAQAVIGINPLRTGGGIKQKLLEAMALQRAVVTTAFGRIGVPGEDGQHFLIADTADAFASACIHLLQNKAVRDHVAKTARRLIEEKFSWDRAVEQLDAIYKRLIYNHPS